MCEGDGGWCSGALPWGPATCSASSLTLSSLGDSHPEPEPGALFMGSFEGNKAGVKPKCPALGGRDRTQPGEGCLLLLACGLS